MASFEGAVTFNFGSAPGTNIVQTTVSNANITTASRVELYMMGTDSTATHNAYEHALLPLDLALSVTTITNAVSFVAQAATTLRLTGTIAARYVFST